MLCKSYLYTLHTILLLVLCITYLSVTGCLQIFFIVPADKKQFFILMQLKLSSVFPSKLYFFVLRNPSLSYNHKYGLFYSKFCFQNLKYRLILLFGIYAFGKPFVIYQISMYAGLFIDYSIPWIYFSVSIYTNTHGLIKS